VTQAQTLVAALNAIAKRPQFDHTKARATARKDANVDWNKTKAENEDFNPEVDGCPTFVMLDGSACAWNPGRAQYAAKSGV
jgi:hypothetical protein